MSLCMSIFHGRLDPDENLDDWGFNGPKLNHIKSFDYQSGSLFLISTSKKYFLETRNLTGWSVIDTFDEKLFNKVYFPALHNQRGDFIACLDSPSNMLFYYSDFSIVSTDAQRSIALHLMTGAQDENPAFAQKDKLVIDQITTVRFTYGNYVVWFKNIIDSHKAMALTGWKAFVDDLSLEVSINPLTKAIIVYQPDGTKTLYDRFSIFSD